MGKMKFVVMLGAMLLAASSASANLVTNPTFDGGTDFNGWAASTAFSTGGLVQGVGCVYTTWGPSLNPMTQTIATVAGDTYSVSVDVAFSAVGGTDPLVVTVGDLTPISITSAIMPTDAAWYTATGTFTADTTGALLTVDLAAAQATWAAINNVDVEDTGSTTPEPATMSLLGLGLVGLLARKRKA